VLAWIGNETDYKYDSDLLKFWFILGSSDSLDVADFDFEDIMLKQGDFISLTLMQDSDKDGLFDREEDYYGTDPLVADSDRDLFSDREEADSDRRHPVVPEFPAGKATKQVATIVPTNDFTDVRTLVLLENGTIWDLDGVPLMKETDLEFESIAGGGQSSWGFTWFGITTDGNLYAWGSNKYGKLGIQESQPIEQVEPVMVGSACNCWKKIVAGELHVLALKTDGSLWAWGYDGQGQLGRNEVDIEYCPGSSSDNKCSREPVLVDSGPWFDIAVGSRHSLGIKDDLTLWAWGHNGSGQLGVGDSIDRAIPTRAYDSFYETDGDDIWEMVAAWGNTSLAILDIDIGENNNTVRSWGEQNFTQYGGCSGNINQCGGDYVHIKLVSIVSYGCSSSDSCGEGLFCMAVPPPYQCWLVNPYLEQPRYLPDPNRPDGTNVISLSAGPFMSVTYGNIIRTGFHPLFRYHWVPVHSTSWGLNEHGETGRGPGGNNVCYHASTGNAPQDCNRWLDVVVDDNTDPFLIIEKGRGISAPPLAGVSDNPPPTLGELNVWGINNAGQLGLGAGSPAQVSEPELMPEHPLP